MLAAAISQYLRGCQNISQMRCALIVMTVSVHIFIFGFWKKRERVTKQSGRKFAGMKGAENEKKS